MKKKHLSLEDFIRRKDEKLDCPRCWKPMRYKVVPARMAKWSPGPYAWRCPACSVVVLDGSIDPSERTWDQKIKEDGKRRLSSYLSSILRGPKKM